MDESKKHFRLGLFVIVTLTLLFGLLFLLSGQSLFKPKLTFETYFDNSVSGLEVGSPVLYRGVPLGMVIAIELSNSVYEADISVQDRKSYVIVRSEITGTQSAVHDWKKNVQISVNKGLRAQTQMAGITGQQYLSLDYINTDPNTDLTFTWQPDYTYVPSAKSSTRKIIAGIQTLISGLDEADFASMGKNINALLVTLNQKLQPINTAEVSNQAVELLRQLNQTMTRIDTLIAQSQMDQTFSNINSASANLDKLLADPKIKQIVSLLDDTIQRIDAILSDNQYDLNNMIRDLRVTAANLKDLSDTAKRNPSGILFGGAPEKINLKDKK